MTRNEYYRLYFRYYDMSTEDLQKRIGELHDKKFYDHDITVFTEHRIASRVYLDRTRTDNTLVYHLQKFIK